MEASACLAFPFAVPFAVPFGDALLSRASREVACSSKESLGVPARLALGLGVAELSVDGSPFLMKNCCRFSRGTKMLFGLPTEEPLALGSGSDRVSTLLLGYLQKRPIAA